MTGTNKRMQLFLPLVVFATVSATAELQLAPDDGSPSSPAVSASLDSNSGRTNSPAGPTASAGNQGTDILQFSNKDKLHGTLVSLDPAAYGLRWKHGDAQKAIDFSLADIVEARLGARKTADHKPDTASVLLSNDDLLRGRIISLDKDKLVFDTWYAGKITIKHAMLKKIFAGAKSAVVYEGPVSLDEWTVGRRGNREAWKFNDGALYENREAPIAKDIDNMPDMVDIQFDASWRGGYPSFSFDFFNDNTMQAASCYLLQVSGGNIYLNRCDKNSGSQSLGNADFQRFSNGRSSGAKFNILVDKAKKTIALLIDGQMIRQWVDSNSFAGRGKVIMFHPQQQQGLKISNIRISEWDGTIAQSGGTGDDSTEMKEDLIKLVNGDKVSGHLKSITGENAKFEASYAAMDIPMERIAEITLATTGTERARRNKDDIKAVFSEKGAVTIRLVKMDKNMLIGSSENFGEINMPVEAFSSLQFNIYRDKPADTSDDDDSSL